MDKKDDYTEFESLLKNMINSAQNVVYGSINPDKLIWVKRLLVLTIANTLLSIDEPKLAEQVLIDSEDVLTPTEEEKKELQEIINK